MRASFIGLFVATVALPSAGYASAIDDIVEEIRANVRSPHPVHGLSPQSCSNLRALANNTQILQILESCAPHSGFTPDVPPLLARMAAENRADFARVLGALRDGVPRVRIGRVVGGTATLGAGGLLVADAVTADRQEDGHFTPWSRNQMIVGAATGGAGAQLIYGARATSPSPFSQNPTQYAQQIWTQAHAIHMCASSGAPQSSLPGAVQFNSTSAASQELQALLQQGPAATQAIVTHVDSVLQTLETAALHPVHPSMITLTLGTLGRENPDATYESIVENRRNDPRFDFAERMNAVTANGCRYLAESAMPAIAQAASAQAFHTQQRRARPAQAAPFDLAVGRTLQTQVHETPNTTLSPSQVGASVAGASAARVAIGAAARSSPVLGAAATLVTQ